MDVDLLVERRIATGKGAARRLRGASMVPAILYGPKSAPMPVAVSAIRLQKLMREMGEESKLIQLTVDDGQKQEKRQVLIREVQTHPVRQQFLHVDFYEVPLDQPILVEVPVEITGESIGEKKGGVLELIRRTLEVRCLPEKIPEKIRIDVSSLDLGGSIHVGDLMDGVDFELVDDKNLAVISMSSPASATAEETGAE